MKHAKSFFLTLTLILGLTMIVTASSPLQSAPPKCGEQEEGTFDNGTWECDGPHRDCTVTRVCEPPL